MEVTSQDQIYAYIAEDLKWLGVFSPPAGLPDGDYELYTTQYDNTIPETEERQLIRFTDTIEVRDGEFLFRPLALAVTRIEVASTANIQRVGVERILSDYREVRSFDKQYKNEEKTMEYGVAYLSHPFVESVAWDGKAFELGTGS